MSGCGITTGRRVAEPAARRRARAANPILTGRLCSVDAPLERLAGAPPVPNPLALLRPRRRAAVRRAAARRPSSTQAAERGGASRLGQRADRPAATGPGQRLRRRRSRQPGSGGPLRPRSGVRAQHDRQHGHGHQPAHAEGRRAVPHRPRAPARHAGLEPQPALRRQRPGQQPDADRPAHRDSRARRSRSRIPTTCTSPPTGTTRSSSPSACYALDFRDPQTMRLVHSLSVPTAAASTTWTSRPTAATHLPAASSLGA